MKISKILFLIVFLINQDVLSMDSKCQNSMPEFNNLNGYNLSRKRKGFEFDYIKEALLLIRQIKAEKYILKISSIVLSNRDSAKPNTRNYLIEKGFYQKCYDKVIDTRKKIQSAQKKLTLYKHYFENDLKDIFNQSLEEPLEYISNQALEEFLKDISNQSLKEPLEYISNQVSNQALEEFLKYISNQSLEESLEDISNQVSNQALKEFLKDISNQALEKF